jgi:hypothetical protein
VNMDPIKGGEFLELNDCSILTETMLNGVSAREV